MAVLSKAMSNGYPSSAIIGIREVMDEAQDSFISSCMWTERIGFVSALATIKKFKRLSLQKKLIDHGQRIKKGWLQISKSTDVDITIAGIDPIPQFNFKKTFRKEHLYESRDA